MPSPFCSGDWVRHDTRHEPTPELPLSGFPFGTANEFLFVIAMRLESIPACEPGTPWVVEVLPTVLGKKNHPTRGVGALTDLRPILHKQISCRKEEHG
jgi:hypothetical protein